MIGLVIGVLVVAFAAAALFFANEIRVYRRAKAARMVRS